MKSIEIVFAEFGGKFSPDITNIRQFFPEANINIFTEKNVENKFDSNSTHWGNFMNDYWKVRKLLESHSDIAISFDADIKIVSENVKAIIPLVEKFGLCLPSNPRKLVKIDTEMGSHSDGVLDETLGMGYAFNMTPIAVDTKNLEAMRVLRIFCDLMEKNPIRGTLAMWRACYQAGFFPCLLPPQWCVCGEDIGIQEPIILHVGHEKVREYYATIV
jgi:hypothetical protein